MHTHVAANGGYLFGRNAGRDPDMPTSLTSIMDCGGLVGRMTHERSYFGCLEARSFHVRGKLVARAVEADVLAGAWPEMPVHIVETFPAGGVECIEVIVRFSPGIEVDQKAPDKFYLIFVLWKHKFKGSILAVSSKGISFGILDMQLEPMELRLLPFAWSKAGGDSGSEPITNDMIQRI